MKEDFDVNLWYDSFREEEKTILARLRSGAEPIIAAEYNLYLANVAFAYYEICINRNYKNAQNTFYKAAMVAVQSIKIPRSRESVPVEAYFPYIFTVFLSGNKILINYFLSEKVFTVGYEKYGGYYLLKTIQSVFKKDMYDAGHWLERFEKFTNNKWKAGKNFVIFFRGIIASDMIMINEGIKYYLKRRTTTFYFLSGCFALEAAFLMKMAYLLNINIDIDSSYVPLELVRNNPLESYEGYDFFKAIEEYMIPG